MSHPLTPNFRGLPPFVEPSFQVAIVRDPSQGTGGKIVKTPKKTAKETY